MWNRWCVYGYMQHMLLHQHAFAHLCTHAQNALVIFWPQAKCTWYSREAWAPYKPSLSCDQCSASWGVFLLYLWSSGWPLRFGPQLLTLRPTRTPLCGSFSTTVRPVSRNSPGQALVSIRQQVPPLRSRLCLLLRQVGAAHTSELPVRHEGLGPDDARGSPVTHKLLPLEELPLGVLLTMAWETDTTSQRRLLQQDLLTRRLRVAVQREYRRPSTTQSSERHGEAKRRTQLRSGSSIACARAW